MPDQRRPSRRASDERPTARAAAHLAVLGLLAVTIAVGVRATAVGSSSNSDAKSFPFNIISIARGADAAAAAPQVVRYNLVPQPATPETTIDRHGIVEQPRATPLPTPVAPPKPPPAPRAVYVKPAPIVGNGQLLWPVPGGVITQYYSSHHMALDIAAPAGSKVIAAAAGTVTWAGWKNNGGGYVISITHGNGIVTVYNHLGSMWVGVGAVVTAGQGIAAVGCTGDCTGPHVHFEVIVNGVLVNPLRYL